jgi:hypothetical protein
MAVDAERPFVGVTGAMRPSGEPGAPVDVGAYTVRFADDAPVVEYHPERGDDQSLLWYIHENGEVRFVEPDLRRRHRIIATEEGTYAIIETRHDLVRDDITYIDTLLERLQHHNEILTQAGIEAGLTNGDMTAIFTEYDPVAEQVMGRALTAALVDGRLSPGTVRALGLNADVVHRMLADGDELHDPFTGEDIAIRLGPIVERLRTYYNAMATSYSLEAEFESVEDTPAPPTAAELEQGEIASVLFETLAGDEPTAQERSNAGAIGEVNLWLAEIGMSLFGKSLLDNFEDRDADVIDAASVVGRQLANIPGTLELLEHGQAALDAMARYVTAYIERPVIAQTLLPDETRESIRLAQFVVTNNEGDLEIVADTILADDEAAPRYLPYAHPDGGVQIIHPNNEERYLLYPMDADIDVVHEVICKLRPDAAPYLERLSNLLAQHERLLRALSDNATFEEELRARLVANMRLIDQAIEGDSDDIDAETPEGRWLGLRPVFITLQDYIGAVTGMGEVDD